ncbi:MAG: hypothetical protein WKI48_04255 [Aquificaceae bacterium]
MFILMRRWLKVFELVEGKYREKRDRSFNFEECKVDIKLEEALI